MVQMAPLTYDNYVCNKTGNYNGTDYYLKELFGLDREVKRSMVLSVICRSMYLKIK